jgi:hypothetical protein
VRGGGGCLIMDVFSTSEHETMSIRVGPMMELGGGKMSDNGCSHYF